MFGYMRLFSAFILFASIFITPSFAGEVSLPRTGQTVSYAPGDDGAIQAGLAWPSPRFKDNGDGTISDNLTGLMWLKDGYCVVDSGYAGSGNSAIQWPQAFDFVDKLNNNAFSNISGYAAHYNDWRVPNINELESLIRGDATQYAWLDDYFQNVQNGYYLSSTTAAGNAEANCWFLYSLCGRVAQQAKAAPFFLLPVRGNSATSGAPAQVWQTGQTMTYAAGDDGNLKAGVAWIPDTRFTDKGDGTVADNLTSLMWTKTAGSEQLLWSAALSNISSINSNNYLGHSDWRLPNRKEIRSLIDYSQANPALPAGNPFNVPGSAYWTSTHDPVHHYPVFIYLADGTEWNSADQDVELVWPVRGGITNGQPPVRYTLTINKTGDGTGQVTSSPSGISCGASCVTEQASFDANDVVTLTAAPSSDSVFDGWAGDATGGSSPVNVTMTSSKTITASFGKSSYTLTTAVNPASVGTVNLSAQGPYSPGTQVTLTANPKAGYQFSGWSGDASGTQNPLAVTMNKDMAITANFTELPDSLSMYYDQSGKTITFDASLEMNGGMAPNQNVQFFETVNGKDILRCTAVTGMSGTCQKKMSFQAGTHTWFAKSGQEVSAPVSCIIGAVTALSPVNMAVVPTPDPDLSWQVYDNATGYEVQVSKSAIFPAKYTSAYSVSGTDFNGETPLSPGQRIYWRVTAVLPTGTSVPSVTGSAVYKVATNLSLSLISVSNNKGTFQAALTDPHGSGIPGKRIKITGKYSASGVTGVGGVLVKTVPLPLGSYSVKAAFAGDATYAPSVSSPVSGVIGQ